MQCFFPTHRHTWQLEECITVPENCLSGKVKCRILYDAHHFGLHYSGYDLKPPSSLKLVHISSAEDYRYKYADRSLLTELFEQREDADDVLIIREDWVTDTSIANIAFIKNGSWYTPSIPLLAGTTWKRLISERILIPRPINQLEIQTFEGFKIFNAMVSFEASQVSPIGNIR